VPAGCSASIQAFIVDVQSQNRNQVCRHALLDDTARHCSLVQ
jgi:hypothetical protein